MKTFINNPMKLFMIFTLTASFLFSQPLASQNIVVEPEVNEILVLRLNEYTGTLQWQVSPYGDEWIDLENETADTLEVNTSNSLYYRASVTVPGCPEYFTDTIKILGSSSSPGTINGFAFRPEPLRHLPTNATIEAASFGIIPGTGENMAPALSSLTDHLATLTEPTTVLFGKGVYHVSGGQAVFDFNGFHNLVIDGNGAEVIIQSPGTDLTSLRNCSNIIFRNFVIDGDPLPFTQGTIVGVDASNGTFDLRIDPGYQDVGDHNLAGGSGRRWGMLKDPNNPGRLKRGGPNYFNVELSAVDLGDRTYRLSLTNTFQINNFKVGDRYVQLINGAAPRNYMADCSVITFENITMYCAGASYLGVRNKNINVLSCRTILKDDRLASSTADGILLQAGENGPWVENVVFEGISDDGLNVYQKPTWARQVIAERRLLLITGNTPFDVGDTLAFFDPVEGRILARRKVLSRTNTPEGVETFFDDDVPGLRVGSVAVLGGGSGGKVKVYEGAGINSTQVYNEKYLTGPTVVRNCTFKNSRNKATQLQSHNVIYENNLIEGWDKNAIIIINNVDYPGGFHGNNIIIRNNLIKDGGFNSNIGGGIYFRLAALQGKPAESTDMHNLEINGNIIINPGSWALNGASFAEVRITENTIIFTDGANRPGAISMFNTPHSSCSDNTIIVSGGPTSSAQIDLDPNVNVNNEGNVVLTTMSAAEIEEIERKWRERFNIRTK